MDCYCIAGVVIFILLIAAIMIVVKRDSINRFFSAGTKVDTITGGGKKTKKRITTSHIAKLSNIHHNPGAHYVFVYLSDIYPKGLKEGSKFKALINQTKYKNEAYAVYERPVNGKWVDTLNIDDAWEDFVKKYCNEFKEEISNGARLIFIGKGFGSVYAKIFGSAMENKGIQACTTLALNGIHLREFMPALIMQERGLSTISLKDITFTQKQCIYDGKDYVKVLGMDSRFYTLLYSCDCIENNSYYSFYGAEGSKYIEIEPFNVVYDNTFIVKYGKRFMSNDWLKNPKLLESVIKKVI